MKKFPYIIKDSNGIFIKGFMGLVAAMNYADRKGLIIEFTHEYNV